MTDAHEVRFHIEDGEAIRDQPMTHAAYHDQTHAQAMPLKAAPAVPAVVGVQAPVGTAGVPLAPVHGGIVGRFPREALYTVRTAPVLAAITAFCGIAYFGWFVVHVILASLHDQASESVVSLQALGQDPGLLQVLSSPLYRLLAGLSTQFCYDSIWIWIPLAACWIAVIQQTRQARAVALFATTWGVFTWFIYTETVFQGFDKGYDLNASFWELRWWRIMVAHGAFSCILEAGKFAAWCWALERFLRTRGLEPYCELDKSDLAMMERRAARTPAENERRAAANAESIQIIDTPAGLAQVEVPAGHVPRTSLAECRIDEPGKAVLFFAWLSVIGFIISMLSYIPIQMLGNSGTQLDRHPPTPVLVPGLPAAVPYVPIQGRNFELNFVTNEALMAFHLFWAIGLSVAAAYDRVRDTSVSPIVLSVLSSFGMLGMFIYSARRIHLVQNGSEGNSFSAQVAVVVGMGITMCCEILRTFVLVFKMRLLPAAVDPMLTDKTADRTQPATAHGRGRFWAMLTHFLTALLLLITFAWLIVIIALESAEGLFGFYPATAVTVGGRQVLVPNSNPRWTFVNGQQTAEDALVYNYTMFISSIILLGYAIAVAFYARLRQDRVGNLVWFSTMVLQTATWWQLNWPIAYANAFEDGDMYRTFCRQASGEHVFPENVCDEIHASGRLAIIFFLVYVLLMFVSFLRWLTMPRDIALLEHRNYQLQQAVRLRQLQAQTGTTATGEAVVLPNDTAVLLMEEEKPRHSHMISFLLALILVGWVLIACAVADEGTTAFFLPGMLYASLPADVHWFLSAHYFAVAITFVVFIHAHLALHPTLRHFSYFWRFAQWTSCLWYLFLAIPVLISLGRFINTDDNTRAQPAMFAGLLITCIGTFLELIYCQALFRRYALFTTPAQYSAFHKRHQHFHQHHAGAHNANNLEMTKH